MGLELELTYCHFCKTKKPFVFKVVLGKIPKTICIDCQSKRDSLMPKNHGTHRGDSDGPVPEVYIGRF